MFSFFNLYNCTWDLFRASGKVLCHRHRFLYPFNYGAYLIMYIFYPFYLFLSSADGKLIPTKYAHFRNHSHII